jgi:guanylate kinase
MESRFMNFKHWDTSPWDTSSWNNIPLLISGPSGIGKTYIMNKLLSNNQYNFRRVMSTTTRKKRDRESNNIEYEFVTNKKYTDMENKGEFLISNTFYGAKYGFRKDAFKNVSDSGFTPLVLIYIFTINQIKPLFEDSFSIFLYPKDINFLYYRMKKRGDDANSIEDRMIAAKAEIEYFKESRLKESAHSFYDTSYEVWNDDIDPILEIINNKYRSKA